MEGIETVTNESHNSTPTISTEDTSHEIYNSPATQLEHLEEMQPTYPISLPSTETILNPIPAIKSENYLQTNASELMQDLPNQPLENNAPNVNQSQSSVDINANYVESIAQQQPLTSNPDASTDHKESSLIGTMQKETEPSEEEINRKLSEEQLKYCDGILKSLKKHRDVGPFLLPVDPVALRIPDYPIVIKNPMDLSTIEQKLLVSKEYQNADSFSDDVKLMLNNCYTYNPAETIVHKKGKNLEKHFDNLLKKMPTKESVIAILKGISQPSSSTPIDKKKKIPSASLSGSGTFAASSSAAKKRASTASPGGETPKPKRTASMKQGARSSDDLKLCLSVWKDITRRTNIVWPFMQPVDPIALGIPDYFTIIKEPMDFGTIKKKIDTSAYGSFAEFEADVRLIFSNCYTYNAPDSDVAALCKQIEAAFESKLNSLLPKSKSFVSHEDSGDDSGDDSDTEKMKVLKQQLNQIKSQIAAIVQKRKMRKSSATPSSVSSLPAAAYTGSAHAVSTGKAHKLDKTPSIPKKEKKTAAPVDEISFEEKQKLSNDIALIPPESFDGVIEIIREYLPANKSLNDEIELDMDDMDPRTIRKLQAFVKKVIPDVPTSKVQPPVIVSSSSEETESD